MFQHNGLEFQLTLGGMESPKDSGSGIQTESGLVGLAVALGAPRVTGWSPAEEKLAKKSPRVPPRFLNAVRDRILAGEDPLGDAFSKIRSTVERRSHGATFTPALIVDWMVNSAASVDTPVRIVDPGTGSGRYLLNAGRRFPAAQLIGVEIDPLPAMLARANLAVSGFAARSHVILDDFRSVALPGTGKTLFIGNPPYVRHHLLDARWKEWLTAEAAKRAYSASQLAGLHVHFFMATVAKASKDDFGLFITAAEWLDVNYGSLVRQLFAGDLGGYRIDVIEPTAMPFPDVSTTAAITHFRIGNKPKQIKLRRVEKLDELSSQGSERTVRRDRLETESRWSHLTRTGAKLPTGFVELGELCRVHRGQVTGSNSIWIAGDDCDELPESVLFPTVTKARELFSAGPVLKDASILRRVIDLPVELDIFDAPIRRRIDRFLTKARSLGAHLGYVACNRKAWWAVGLRQPAPILATYMARRPPAFVRNRAEARHINIAHGIYPREPMREALLANLVRHLSRSVCMTQGRTYAGGLTKFEPREMERLWVPGLDLLAAPQE